MHFIINVQDIGTLHEVEEVVEEDGAVVKDITPESLYPLVMNTAACDETASTRPSERMGEHETGYTNILTTTICTNSTR